MRPWRLRQGCLGREEKRLGLQQLGRSVNGGWKVDREGGLLWWLAGESLVRVGSVVGDKSERGRQEKLKGKMGMGGLLGLVAGETRKSEGKS